MDFKKETVIFLEENDEKYAKVVIRREEDNIFNITHVFVDDSHRGEGLAGKLVEEALKFIELHNGVIKTDCSYAASYLEKKKGI